MKKMVSLLLALVLVAVGLGTVAGHHLLGLFFLTGLALLFLLLFQCLDHTVYGLVALFLGHGGELEQRVLQMDGIGIRGQFVKNLRAA